jgi:all-trans-retinol 13,14-reductase
MMKKKCIIIGSGLGGLSTGVILAKNGFDVTILEQDSQIGGCMQCFYRNGVKFETGLHFIGSADKGQVLYNLFQYLGIGKDIQLSRLDTQGYDVVSLAGQQFKFVNGRESFIEKMTGYFPDSKDDLVGYIHLVDKIASASSFHNPNFADSDLSESYKYQMYSLNSVLERLIKNPELREVLVGNMPLYAAQRDKTPFSTHAFIMDFYNNSAFRIVGGNDKVALSMVNTIKQLGGEVLTEQKVTRIDCNDIQATGVRTAEGIFYPADLIISDTHPLRTLEMLDTHLIRPIYRKRIMEMPNTVSCFTIYMKFKPDAVPYMNYNFYSYNGHSPWGCEDYNQSTWPKGYLYMHLCNEPNQKMAEGGVIISYMSMADVKRWQGTTVAHRGTEYEEFKKEKAEKLLEQVEHDFPCLRNQIDHYYTSTPLTYLDYTGTEDGSMYGLLKDVSLGQANRVPYRTKIPNLLFTGQNINSHGALGVLVGTIMTCSTLFQDNRILEQIIAANE